MGLFHRGGDSGIKTEGETREKRPVNERMSLEEARDYFDFAYVGNAGIIVPYYEYELKRKPELPNDPDVDGFSLEIIRKDMQGTSQFYHRFDGYIEPKPNRHILVAGASGCGKTTVFCSIIQKMYQRCGIPSLVLGFKPYRSQREEMTPFLDGIKVLDARKFIPDPFRSREAFIDSYLTAYWISPAKVGIMASNVPVVLGDAWKGCSSWDELLGKLEDRLSETKNAMEKSILLTAKRRFVDDLIPKSAGEQRKFRWDYETPIYLDFQHLSDTQKVFYAKLLLFEVYDALNEPDVEVPEFMICVDEAHKIFRETVIGAEQSAMAKICRLARSQGGRVLLSSQNLCDFGADKFSQVKGAQFISKDDHPNDAEIFRTRHRDLPEYIQSLRKYDFVDLTSRHLLHRFVVYRITRLPELNDKVTPGDANKFSIGTGAIDTGVKLPDKEIGGKTAEGKTISKGKTVEIDDQKLENKILNYLTDRASYVTELGREFSEEFDKDASKLKVDCHRLLKPLVGSGAIRRRKLEDGYGNERVYYFHRNAAESLFHRAMISLTKGLIAREGFELISPKAGCDGAFRLGDKEIGIECETGLKDDLSKFAKDLYKRCRVYDEVWVICRNASDRKRYHDQTKSEVGAPNMRYKNLKSTKEALRRWKKKNEMEKINRVGVKKITQKQTSTKGT